MIETQNDQHQVRSGVENNVKLNAVVTISPQWSLQWLIQSSQWNSPLKKLPYEKCDPAS